ncbi:hypothetical protein KP509_27G005100 [Ceratopteris richardii]|uniref:Uncharacterized protein n=1 Tax=Ceratopteris richardii TaxID=49495 RepID=A0A8T2RDK2_CERRI|nr:hypothetical protein KP509_27G005100 [Ceratopteris richardii]
MLRPPLSASRHPPFPCPRSYPPPAPQLCSPATRNVPPTTRTMPTHTPHTSPHTHLHTHTLTHTLTHTHGHATHTPLHTHSHTQSHTHSHTHPCTHTHSHTHPCTHTHTHTHNWNSKGLSKVVNAITPSQGSGGFSKQIKPDFRGTRTGCALKGTRSQQGQKGRNMTLKRRIMKGVRRLLCAG